MTKALHRLTEVDKEKMTATCSQCGPNSELHVGGISRQCKKARNESKRRARARARANNPRPPDLGSKGTKPKSLHGLSREFRQEQYQRQNGICLICGNHFDALMADHDHKTGKFRGMLCHKCNLGLGFFQDNKKTLLSAIDYLDKT